MEFTNILIGSPLPLHQGLSDYPRLSVRVIADGHVCEETPAVDGDPKAGLWEPRATLHVPKVKQSLTFAVVSNRGRIKVRVAAATFSVKKLLERVKQRPLGYHEFSICESGSSMLVLMTCSVKSIGTSIVDTFLSRTVTHERHPTNMPRKLREEGMGSGFGGMDSSLFPREQLELIYTRSYLLNQDDKARVLNRLGSAYNALYDESSDKADLEKSISMHEEAMHCVALTVRFIQTGDVADIERAVRLHQDALAWTDDGDPERPSRLVGFGNALQLRFKHFGDLADVEEAISCQQQAVDLCDDDAGRSTALSNLGGALLIRFERVGTLADIDNAISLKQKAVALTPDGHPEKPGGLSNLGNALEIRFERLGSLKDIDDAISLKQKPVKLTPDGHPNKPNRVSNLGNALQIRFERLGSLTDIDDAISLKQKAVELTPDGHPEKPAQLNNLGAALQIRFERLGSLTDIEDAISIMQKAVELTPDGHPDLPSQLPNLGNALRTRFERLGSLSDIEAAISSMQKAVELMPDGHPNKPAQLNNLCIALQRRFQRLGSLSDIDETISRLQKAVDSTADGHPNKPGRLYNLSTALATRFEHFNAIEDLESALQNYSTAATSPTGPAMARFTAAHAWARYTNKYSRSPLSAYRCAIELLPRIAWLGLTVTDQHALLADVGHVVRDTVEAAIRYEEYETAVEWAEQGRSIVWQNLLGLRTPLDRLRAAYPQLADRIQTVTSQLEASSPSNDVSDGEGADVARKASELATEWEGIVEEIRQLPGFKGFLKAKTFAELAPAAYEGPVVVLNVHESRCDALILLPDDSEDRNVSVIYVPLERFSEDTSNKLFQILKSLLSSAGLRARDINRKTERYQSQMDVNNKFRTILRILWQDVVKTVLESLAYPAQPGHPSRIWWCATGSLAFLPIHAAGLYNTKQVGEMASDYVISSYTPSLTAILDLSQPIVGKYFQLLTVAQPSTPGATPIPKTENEIKIVQTLSHGLHVVDLVGEVATVGRVLQGMKESDWIHLACHGQQNSENALNSGFLLHHGTLKLSEIVAVIGSRVDFASLSACETAVGDEKVTEESAHLAAGMLSSGCRGVIATMWSIRDDDGPRIAEDVYSRILKGGRPNRKEAAYALQEAVRRLRELGAGFMAWVPFIHIGR